MSDDNEPFLTIKNILEKPQSVQKITEQVINIYERTVLLLK